MKFFKGLRNIHGYSGRNRGTCEAVKRQEERNGRKVLGPALCRSSSILPERKASIASAPSGTRNNQSDLAIRNSAALARWEVEEIKEKKDGTKGEDLSRVGGHHLNQPPLLPRSWISNADNYQSHRRRCVASTRSPRE